MNDSGTKKKRIIIVEDKSIVSHDIKRRLEVLGYEVPGIAPSGEKAIELVKEHTPDLVLMDIQLEGNMDGIEAADHIRKELDIPIIYLTAFSDNATLKRAMITEPYAYIIKPFEPRELQISIEIALYKHDMETALIESEEKFRSLVEEAGDGIIVIDENARIALVNDYLLKLGGYEREDVLGKEFMDFVPDKYLPATIEMFEKAINGEDGPAMEIELKRKDGSSTPVGYKGSAIFKDGEFQGIRAIIRDVSLRKQMERALKDSEELYRTMFESSADAVMMLDKEGFFDCNEATLYMFGFEHKSEFIGIHPSKLSPPEQPDGIDSLTASNRKIQDAYDWGHNRFEWVHRRVSGEDFPAEVWLTAFELKGRQVLQATIRDLTERKRMEAELEKHRMHLEQMVEEAYKDLSESEEKYRILVERANDGIIIILEGKVVFANKKVTEMLGHDMDEVIDKDFTSFLPPEIKEQVLDLYKRRMAGENIPSIYEIVLKKKDETLIPVEINAGIITYNNMTADLALIRDLTERKKSEKSLIASEEKYRKLMETANDAIFLADADTGELIDANIKAELLIGRSRDEIIGMHQSELHPLDEVENYIQIFKEHVLDGSSISEDIFVIHKDGHRIPVIISASTFKLDGKMVSQGIFHDITDIKKAKDEIVRKTREWETTFNSMSDWVSLIDSDSSQILQSNRSSMEIINQTPEDIIGKVCHEIVHKGARPEDCPLAKSKISGNRETMEFEEDGRWFHVSVDPVKNGFDETTNFVHIVRDITEQKKADAALAESEEKFRGLAEQSPNMIFINQGGKLAYVNPVCEDVMGYTSEEFYDKDFDFMGLIHPEYKELVGKMFGMHQQGLEVPPYEYVILAKDGGEIDVINSTKAITFMGEPAILGIITDISKIKEAEAEQRKSEERFRILAETTTAATFIHRGGNFLFFNKATEDISGYSKEELMNMNFLEMVHPDYVELVKERAMARLKGEDITPNYEIKVIRKDGREIWLGLTGSQINFQGEEAIIGTAFDITERKKAEETPLLTQFMLDRLSDAAFWMDSEARFFYVNNAACENLGYTRAELLEMTVHDIDPNFTKDVWPEHWAHILEKNSFTIESVHKKKDGSVYPVEVAINYIRYKDEEYNCAIARDITRRKEADRNLREGERFLANVFESIQDGLIVMDTDLKIVSTNQTIERWFPYLMPFEGKTCNDLLQCDEPGSECKCPNPDVLTTKNSERRTIRKLDQNNNPIGWLELHSFPLHDVDTGELTGVIEYIRDITEQRKAEKEKLELEEFSELTIMNSPVAIATTDMNGNIITVNPAMLETLGSPSADETRKYNVLTFPLLKKQGLSELFEKCIKNGETIKKNGITYTSAWGKASVNNLKIVPLLNSDKDQIGSMVMMDDITEQVKAEEEKEKFQNQLDAFFQASTDGIGIQKDGRFIYANPKLVELFGCDDISEIIGTAARSYMTLESADMTKDYHDMRVRGEDAPKYYEFEILRKDGTTIDAEVSISVYRVKDEFFTVSFIRDITELKKSREQETERRILEAQFEMKTVITDLVPIFLDSMGSEGRANFVSNLSDKLDKILRDRYYDKDKHTAREVSEIYCQVLEDLGGEAQPDCPIDPMNCSNIVIKCPWSNEKTKNLILCILCRGIAWRFAQYSDQALAVQLEHTMADGHPDCKITVSEKK